MSLKWNKLSIEDILKYFQTVGALNAAYDPNLDGLISSSKLDFSFTWELLGHISAWAPAISFNNLSGDTDKLYMIIATIYNSWSNSDAGTRIFFNSDSTRENYMIMDWGVSGGTTSYLSKPFGDTTYRGGCVLFGLNPYETGFGIMFINALGISNGTNTYVYTLSLGAKQTTGLEIAACGWIKNGEITSIELQPLNFAYHYFDVYLFKAKW